MQSSFRVLAYLCVPVVCLFLAASRQASGEDFTQWGGSSARTMSSPEKGLPTIFEPGKKKRDYLGLDLSTAKNVQWAVRLGTENYSAPTIANGRVYIGANDEQLQEDRFRATFGGQLVCLNESTGKLLWRLAVPRLEIDRSLVSEDFDDMNLGICSTATIDGNRVYIVTNRCEVLCLDVNGMADGNQGEYQDEAKFSVPEDSPPMKLEATDADILWRLDMIRDLPVFPHDAANCSLLIHGEFAYVVTANGVYDGKVVLPTAASLIVLDKTNGDLIARDDGHISADVFHGQWSSPTLAVVNGKEQIIFGAGDGWCYGFEPIAPGTKAAAQPQILKEIWKFDCNPPGYRSREDKLIDYWALVRGTAGETFGSGSRLISPSEIIGTPAFYRGKIYVGIGQDPVHGPGAGALTCIDPNGTGNITKSNCVWQYTEIGRSMSTVSCADGLIFAAEHAGKVHCLDAQTGKVYWVHDTKEEIWASTLVADGKLYIGTRKGLIVMAASAEQEELADIKLGYPVWSAATAANGTLFVASQRNLWAVKEKGEVE